MKQRLACNIIPKLLLCMLENKQLYKRDAAMSVPANGGSRFLLKLIGMSNVRRMLDASAHLIWRGLVDFSTSVVTFYMLAQVAAVFMLHVW
jgi:hypothetical protein